MDRFHKVTVSPGTFRYNILENNRTYVEKHTVTYTSFFVQTNQICIIISTEVIPYPGTSTGTIFIPRVLQCNEMSRKNAPDLSQGIKFTPTTADPNHCTILHIQMLQPYYHITISPFMPKKT